MATLKENLYHWELVIEGPVSSPYEGYKFLKPIHYYNMIRGLVPETVVGKIYNGWELIDEIPREAMYIRNGLDFGYTNDPTALVAIYKWNNAYIFDLLIYQKGMKNGEIASVIKKNGNMMTIADSAEPKSIDDLTDHGANVYPAQKGPGSLLQGIEHMQSLKIFVTKRSKPMWKEYESYAWLVDKKTGELVNDPKPGQADHAMDGGRYGVQYDLGDSVQEEVFVTGGGVQGYYKEDPIGGAIHAGLEFDDMSGGTPFQL